MQRRPGDEKAALNDLQARIDATRAARRPKRNPGADKFNAAALAWRMVTELVVGVLLGAGIGWGLDSVAGTLPLLLILFTLLGFAAGVRTMLRSADEMRRRDARAGEAAQGAALGVGASMRPAPRGTGPMGPQNDRPIGPLDDKGPAAGAGERGNSVG
jgi:ATP synthase protein I